MKNTHIAIIVLVLVVLGGFLFMGKGGKVEAPADDMDSMAGMEGMDTSTTPPKPTTPKTSSTPKPSTAPAPVVANGVTKEFTVSGINYSFVPTSLKVNKGDTVVIHFKSKSGFHDFVIDEFNVKTKQMQSGGEETVTFVASKTGSFQFYCSVGSHRAMGMWGTLKVE